MLIGPLPTTRSIAKALGVVRYRTGKPCLRGHTEDRFASTGQCYACIDAMNKVWRKENAEKTLLASKRWRDRQPNPERKPRTRMTANERNRKYRLKKNGFTGANLSIRCIPLDPKVQWAIYYERNKNTISETQRVYRKKNYEALKQAWDDWYSKNRPSQVEKATMRRRKVVRATPIWLTDEHRHEISSIYRECIRVAVETGVPHHVDHIVPIAGRNVSGLHVPWNLSVIPAIDNIRKSNKHAT